MNCDRCVCCGEIIPEGRQVCPGCEADPEHALKLLICRRAATNPDIYSCESEKMYEVENRLRRQIEIRMLEESGFEI